MTIIKKLTVSTDEEREQWVEMLKLASDYHYDMAAQFAPDIIGDKEMEEVARIHRAWGRAIQEASELIYFWEVEENDDILLPEMHNVTPQKEIDEYTTDSEHK